ncbi:unnamed protein product, partial [Didymodactylos carnosus]
KAAFQALKLNKNKKVINISQGELLALKGLQLLDEQYGIIEKSLVQNGYPVSLIKRKMKNTIEQFQKPQPPTQLQLRTKKVFIPLTYHGLETLKMSNRIKNVTESVFPTVELIFGYKRGLTLAKLFTKNFKGKDPSEIGVVYKLTCDKCAKIYIGQTKLNVKERMKQHRDALLNPGSSRAADHMIENKNHRVEFSAPEILAREKGWKRREIKETLWTLKSDSTYNKISHELLIFSE